MQFSHSIEQWWVLNGMKMYQPQNDMTLIKRVQRGAGWNAFGARVKIWN
jgi:hypothetical protein